MGNSAGVAISPPPDHPVNQSALDILRAGRAKNKTDADKVIDDRYDKAEAGLPNSNNNSAHPNAHDLLNAGRARDKVAVQKQIDDQYNNCEARIKSLPESAQAPAASNFVNAVSAWVGNNLVGSLEDAANTVFNGVGSGFDTIKGGIETGVNTIAHGFGL